MNVGGKLDINVEEIRARYPRESEIPFDSDRKMMSTKHTIEGIPVMVVKGATDVLLSRATQIMDN